MSLVIRNIVHRAKIKNRPNILLLPFNGQWESQLTSVLKRYNFFSCNKLALIQFGNYRIKDCAFLEQDRHRWTVGIDLIVNNNPMIHANVVKLSRELHCPVLNIYHQDAVNESESIVVPSKNLGGSISYFFKSEPTDESEKDLIAIRYVSQDYKEAIANLQRALAAKKYKTFIFTEDMPIENVVKKTKILIDLAVDNIIPYYPLAFASFKVPTLSLKSSVREKTIFEGSTLCENMDSILMQVDQIFTRLSVYTNLVDNCVSMISEYNMNNANEWEVTFDKHLNRTYNL